MLRPHPFDADEHTHALCLGHSGECLGCAVERLGATPSPEVAADLAALTPEFVNVRLNETLREEVECLRAIIDGRTTPPTQAEIAAHEAAGGAWLFFETKNAEGQPLHDAAPAVADHEFSAYEAREGQVLLGHAVRWWPLDATGRPCAWPVVAPKGGA